MTLDLGVTSVFSDRTLFTTLASSSFAESGVSALSRGMRTVLNPLGIEGILGERKSVIGYSADTPSLFFRPVDIGLTNTVLLLSQSTGVGEGGFGAPSKIATDAYAFLNSNALNDSLPTIRNLSESIINSTSFEILLSEQAQSFVSSAISGPEAEPDPLILDFTNRPLEATSFGDTYSSVAADSSLNAQFYRRVGLSQGSSVNLADLLLVGSSGSPTNLAVRLLSEVGEDGIGAITDNLNNPVATDVVINYADLGNYTYTAVGNKNTDYLSFIELEDVGNDGSYEGRGEIQTVSISTSTERQDAYDDNEPTIDFKFYAEGGTSTKRLTLRLSGVDALGYTDALDAINQGDLRVQASETLPDGAVNLAITDLYVSDTNDIIVQFAYQQAEDGLRINGIDVEVRGLNTSLDLTGVDVLAIFA